MRQGLIEHHPIDEHPRQVWLELSDHRQTALVGRRLQTLDEIGHQMIEIQHHRSDRLGARIQF